MGTRFQLVYKRSVQSKSSQFVTGAVTGRGCSVQRNEVETSAQSLVSASTTSAHELSKFV